LNWGGEDNDVEIIVATQDCYWFSINYSEWFTDRFRILIDYVYELFFVVVDDLHRHELMTMNLEMRNSW